MTSIIKVDNLQNQCGANIISESANVITIGASGDTVTLAAGASQSGFGRTGTVNWDTTKKTTGFTSISGNGYFCDTTSSAFTATLPATPSAGDIVAFSDYTGTWGTNNLTVGRNGSNINAAATDLILNGNNTTATLIYVDATEGWRVIDTGSLSEVNNIKYVAATGGTITTCGDFKIHTFTGPGTFTVCSAGNSLGSNSVDYLVVAGGGGGGRGTCNVNGAGGGGAGGYRQNYPSPTTAGLPVTAQGYPITVGAGGASNISGNNSIFSTITSTAGGNGGGGVAEAGNGGSGGGSKVTGGSSNPVGSGNTPPVSPPQGNPGGLSTSSSPFRGGGGGGAGAAGTAGNAGPTGGPGGVGLANSITGSPVFYSGGGGAGTNATGARGLGGNGGGGDGSPSISTPGNAGTTNTGGGGGGGGDTGPAGGAGGSGVVVIRYKFQ
jgi:hypothetical protein